MSGQADSGQARGGQSPHGLPLSPGLELDGQVALELPPAAEALEPPDREPPDREAYRTRRPRLAVRFTGWGDGPAAAKVRRPDLEFGSVAAAERYATAERRGGETATIVHLATGGVVRRLEA